MRLLPNVLAAVLALAPLCADAADLVVWWEKGVNPEEDAAVRETIAAFEQETGKQVDLEQPLQEGENNIEAKVLAAVSAGQLPDFLFGSNTDYYYGQWAEEGRLVDLSDVIGPFASLFDPDALRYATLLDLHYPRLAQSPRAGRLYLSRRSQAVGCLLVLWCDRVQPAVRQATGRDDIWGVGLSMSAEGVDTNNGFEQFMEAYQANYVSREDKLVIDDPEIRHRLTRTMDSYTAVYRKGCTPPGAVGWDGRGNNQAFLAQTIVMTPNQTLSIMNALRSERPEDYYKNAATIEWPDAADGRPLPIVIGFYSATAFKAGGHVPLVKEFIRFLVEDGWLAHYLDFSQDRYMPSMPKLLDAPFWLDPSDPHRMPAAMQFLTHPRDQMLAVAAYDWRYSLPNRELVWPKAVHRVVAEGISPEQAVDEAIARIKQILSKLGAARLLARGFVPLHELLPTKSWPRAVATGQEVRQLRRAGGCRRPGAGRAPGRTARPDRAHPGRRAARRRHRSRSAPRAA
jgi:multiple sugar transport system substrate-binding protein